MTKQTIAVLFGGVSSEYEVSLRSAASVLRNLPNDRFLSILIGITKDGRWLRFFGDADAIESGAWLADPANRPAIPSPDRSVHGLLVETESGHWQPVRVDIVFPVLHGRNGEDGRVQGLLELAGIPYVGCDLLSSAVCMDKAVTNTILDHNGIARAPWAVFHLRQLPDLEDQIDDWEVRFGYPMFVKPANAGSSVGISKARDRQGLRDAVALALAHDNKILIEKNIVGRELECSVLGNEEPIASLVGEILPANEFYDYDAKYLSTASKTKVPADLDPVCQAEIQRIAIRAYQVLGCSGMARVDFLYEAATGAILLNELNTIPGFTSISMYAKMLDASGISYSELLMRLAELAVERMESEK